MVWICLWDLWIYAFLAFFPLFFVFPFFLGLGGLVVHRPWQPHTRAVVLITGAPPPRCSLPSHGCHPPSTAPIASTMAMARAAVLSGDVALWEGEVERREGMRRDGAAVRVARRCSDQGARRHLPAGRPFPVRRATTQVWDSFLPFSFLVLVLCDLLLVLADFGGHGKLRRCAGVVLVEPKGSIGSFLLGWGSWSESHGCLGSSALPLTCHCSHRSYPTTAPLLSCCGLHPVCRCHPETEVKRMEWRSWKAGARLGALSLPSEIAAWFCRSDNLSSPQWSRNPMVANARLLPWS
uniref:Uncharacterized protein n=1 Tax=Arundo donax TaxID=35708 RepID=A0A0A9CU37_ARUDO